jgi:DNA-binding CsgD family transcriptional regulator
VRGELATADRWFTEAAAVFREVGHEGQRRWCVGGRALVSAWRGVPTPELVREIDAGRDLPMKMMETDIDRALAWQAVAAGDPDHGRDALRAAADRALEREAYGLASAALHDLVRLGDHDRSVSALVEVSAHVDGAMIEARCDHALAARKDDAGALDAAARAFDALGARLFAAEAAADAARAARRAGEQRKADQWVRDAARWAEGCEGAATPALRGIGPVVPLTTRQRDVALLASQGLASKEIAKRLGVSARTVDNHLQQVYRKLGVANRIDLADALGLG